METPETEGTSFNALTEIASRCHNTALAKGWWRGNGKSFGEDIALMHSELSEALEHYRHNEPLDKWWIQESGKPDGIPIELADVIIRIFDVCMYHNIPIAKALEVKMQYNESRPYRHGGKAL